MKEVLERLKRLSKEGAAANNLRFYLLDSIEKLNLIATREGEKVGLYDNKNVKVQFDKLRFNVKDLRSLTRGMSEENQENFGEASDKILELLIYAIDRTDDTGRQMDLFIDFIKKFESKQNLNVKRFI